LREHLKVMSIRVTEEQRAMSEGLIRRRREQRHTLPHEFIGALIDFGHRNLECQLKRCAAIWRWSIFRGSAWLRQCQRVVSYPILDPNWRKLSQQRKAEDAFIEAAHRRHVAHEDDGI